MKNNVESGLACLQHLQFEGVSPGTAHRATRRFFTSDLVPLPNVDSLLAEAATGKLACTALVTQLLALQDEFDSVQG